MAAVDVQAARAKSLTAVVTIARAETAELDACIRRLEAELEDTRARRAQAQAALAFCVSSLRERAMETEGDPSVREVVRRSLQTNRGRINRNTAGLTREESALRLLAMRGAAVTARDCAEFFAGGRVGRSNVETSRKALLRLIADGLVIKSGQATYTLAQSTGVEAAHGTESEVSVGFSRAA